LHATVGTQVNLQKGLVRVDEIVVRLRNSKDVIDTAARKGATYFAGAADDDRCYLAAHYGRGSPYSLVAIAQDTGDVLWKAEVWACGGIEAYEGLGHHAVGIEYDTQNVYVFGAADDGVYVEAYSKATGDCAYRFSTAY
jgi:hypothetical protein